MSSFALASTNKVAFKNIILMLRCMAPRRRWQMAFLFLMQLVTASLELVSIGAIIPFLGALTDVGKLMENPVIAGFVDWTGISDPQQLIVILAFFFSVAIVFANIFRFLTLLMQQYLSAAIGVDLGYMLFSKTLYKPYAYFLKNNSSQLIGNTTNDLNATLGTINCFFSIVTQGLIACFIATGLLVYNTEIAIILSVTILTSYSFIMIVVSRRLRHNSHVLSDSYRQVLQILQEGFGGIRYILLGHLQENAAHQFRRIDLKFRRKNAENNVIQQAPRFFLESIGVVAIAVITIGFITRGKEIADIIPLMGFLVFCCYRLLPAVQQIYASISAVIGLSVSVERVLSVVSEPIEKIITEPVRTPLTLIKELTFEQVCFSYQNDDQNWTVKDLDFSIKAKTIVALVGHTGGGKSTISDLILGLISPQKGQIKIDGNTLGPLNMTAWQAGVSHVPQAIFLSDASIAENIAFGVSKDQIDMDRVRRGAVLAQVDSFIESLPNGYQQVVGERGVRLSGGQRQRIGIARALYQNPSLVVFDEATSALDNRTERDVVSAINDLRKDLTIVLIAHRLSTVKYADNILVFEKGCLVAQGTYEDLLENAHFKKLLESEEFQTDDRFTGA